MNASTTTMRKTLNRCGGTGKTALPGGVMVIVLPHPAQGTLRPANSSATVVCFPQCGQVNRIDMTRLRFAKRRQPGGQDMGRPPKR